MLCGNRRAPAICKAELGSALPLHGGPHGTERRAGLRHLRLLLSARASGAGGSLSESRVRRGDRVVHGDKELLEKLGRNDLCPCGSRRRFQELLHAGRRVRWCRS